MNNRTLTMALAVGLIAVAAALSPAPVAALEVLPGSPFGGPEGGVAVDAISGDVYQAEPNENRVVKYDQSGNFILMFGTDVNETTGGNVCPEKTGDKCKAGVAGLGEGELDFPTGVAVDPNTQDVYVNAGTGGLGHEDNRVERYSTNGQYISQIAGGQNGTPNFVIPYRVNGIAVDMNGNLYVVGGGVDGSHNVVLEFNPAGEYTGQSFTVKLGEPLNVAVDEAGNVYVSRDGGHPVLKFAPNGIELGELPCRAHTLAGLAVNLVDGLEDEVFVVGTEPFGLPEEEDPFVCVYDAEGSKVEEFQAAQTHQQLDEITYGASVGRLYEVFGGVWMYGTFPTPPPGPPSVSNEDWSTPGLTSMKVSGRVNPKSLPTQYFFEYATNPELTGATSAPVSPGEAGSSSIPVKVSVNLTGLAQSTTYYYRLVAHNAFAGGTTVDGATQSFTTLAPVSSATTEETPETEITNNAATVHGTVIPGSTGAASETYWCFQYGTADTPAGVYNLGFLPGAPAGDAGQGTEPVAVSARLSRLQPDTTYRYRLIAVNSLGSRLSSNACGSEGGQETDGTEDTFTTGTSGPGPIALSGPPTTVSQAAATLTGAVNPQGTRSTYDFELGTSTEYGVQEFGDAGAGTETAPVSVLISALRPGTTYHYRLVASSRFGTSYGADKAFTTPGYPDAILLAPVTPLQVETPTLQFPRTCKHGYVRNKRGRCVKKKAKKKKKK